MKITHSKLQRQIQIIQEVACMDLAKEQKPLCKLWKD